MTEKKDNGKKVVKCDDYFEYTQKLNNLSNRMISRIVNCINGDFVLKTLWVNSTPQTPNSSILNVTC